MKISLIIPAHNEEKTNDGSRDKTADVVKECFDYYKGKKIKTILIDRKKNLGKPYSMKEGIEKSTGDIIISTDADSVLSLNMVKNIVKPFEDPEVGAATGYVESQRGTSLMAARQIEYLLSLGIHKSGQGIINGIFVIAGCCAAYRKEALGKIEIEGDTLTEDLDITWKLVKAGYKVAYVPEAKVKTQDPPDLRSLWKQLRRWYTGLAQCLGKHSDILGKSRLGKITIPLIIFDATLTSLLYLMVLAISFIDLIVFGSFTGFIWLAGFYLLDLLFGTVTAIYGIYKLKRIDLIKALPHYLVIITINRIVWIYSIVREFTFPLKHKKWEKPKRISFKS